MDITRNDLDGVGRRVSSLREDHIRCSERVNGRIKALEDDTERQEENIGKIFSRLGDVDTKLAEIPGRIDSSVSGMSAKITKNLAAILSVVMIILSALSITANLFFGKGG